MSAPDRGYWAREDERLARQHEVEMEKAKHPRSPWPEAIMWTAFWLAVAAVLIVAMLVGDAR